MGEKRKTPVTRKPPVLHIAHSAPPDARPASERKELARTLWVEHEATEREVCAACSISRGTLRAWRKTCGWDEERKRSAQALGSVAAALRKQLVALAGTLEQTGAGDVERIVALNQALRPCLENYAQARALDRDVDYKRIALRFLRGWVEFLKARDVEALRVLLPHLKAYSKEIALG